MEKLRAKLMSCGDEQEQVSHLKVLADEGRSYTFLQKIQILKEGRCKVKDLNEEEEEKMECL